jgi:hypothetical protein
MINFYGMYYQREFYIEPLSVEKKFNYFSLFYLT